MRMPALLLLLATATSCMAQDYGDADPSYGLASTGDGQYSRLGATCTSDSQNPVSPAWTGDADDGIVGTPPIWDSWSFNNTLTVRLEVETAYLLMWVDTNDNGTFENSEMHEIMPGYPLPPNADYTFTGIRIHATQDFNHNAHNKVAVRIWAQNTIGGPPLRHPAGYVYFGEVEDWLIDVEPAKFVVTNEYLREATEDEGYAAQIAPANSTGPFSWSLLAGQLPQGMTLVQQNDNFVLSGTPQVGTAGVYPITVEVTDGNSATAQRTLELEVTPRPFALPFKDTFSNNNHWKLGTDWSISQATGFVGSGVSGLGYTATEPAHDFTPGNSDEMVLATTAGAEEPLTRTEPTFAESPKVNCSNMSQVQLRFRRFYSAAVGPDNLRVQITSDGANWDTVWSPPHTYGQVCDLHWSLIEVDVSQWAANKAWVRFRFQIGPFVHYYTSSFGFCGWGIDDFEVRETPISIPISAHDFELISSAQHQNQVNAVWYPIAYPQNLHDWTVKIDNPTAQPITISEIEVGVMLDVPAGSGNWWDGPPYYCARDCWYEMGPWTLNQPITVPAGATDYVVSGTYDFAGALAQYSFVVFQAQMRLIGDQNGNDLELQATEHFVPNYAPMPGLYVWEAQAGTTAVHNGEAPTGLRDFGSIGVSGNSNWLNIVIENTDTNALTIGTPTLTGADAGDFALWTQSITSPVAGTGTTYFAVMFLPTSQGVKTATVEFSHSAANTSSPFTFDIKGLGAANSPILAIHETDANGAQIGNNSPAVSGRSFGQQDISAGPTSPLLVYIENTGTQNLVLGSPSVTAANPSAFLLDTNGMLNTLPPGASTTFGVSFDPTSTGWKYATVEFSHNDPGTASPFRFDLEGEGIIAAPLVAVSEGAPYGNPIQPGEAAVQGRQFGTQNTSIGPTAAVRIYIRNDGWSDMTLSTPTLTGVNAGDFQLDVSQVPGVLAGHSVSWFEVSFDPTAKGLKHATVSFGHDDTTVANPFTFDIEGYGDDPNGVTITTPSLAPAKVGEVYSAQLGAAQGSAPYSWALYSGNLPAGLALAPTGEISGTPTGAHALYQFELQVTDSAGGTESRTIDLIVQPPAGYLGKKQGTAGGGGCAADPRGSWLFAVFLLMLACCVWRRQQA